MKKKYLILGIISILILMVGASYAYFTGIVTGEGKRISVSANRLAVIFTDTSEIANVEITPGWSTSKTFTVENKSGGVFYYDINIDNLVNTFVTEGYLQYRITSTDGGYNMESFVDIPKSTNIENNEEEIPSESTDGEVSSVEEEIKRTNLVKNIQIEDKAIHIYKVEFRYQNSEEDQSADMGKIFSGSLSITESNIVVVKYKVNNVIQDEIPDKTEPYIVDKVECSNNAKGRWNEERETVDLESAVTQTVCIVSFKEGNTITVSSEHGEVVSPISKVVGRIGNATFEIEEKAGYSLSDAAIVCDNGAEGSITNKTITITNIKQNNTCRVITNPISITVTYNVNGGNALNPSSKSVIYTSTYGNLPAPTRTGYTFSGWYTAVSGGSKITEDTEVTSTTSHTIYARWNIDSYNVTVNVKNGTPSTQTKRIEYNNSTTFTVKANNEYKLNKAVVICNGGNYEYNQAGTLTVSNIESNITCTITLAPIRITFTIGKDICAKDSTYCSSDEVNDNSGPCYIIKNTSKTVKYNEETYTNCKINSYNLYYYDNARNKTEFTNLDDLNWAEHFWRYGGRDTWAECWVKLTCDN